MTTARLLQLAAETRKAIVSFVTAAAAVSALGLLPAPYDRWVAAGLLVANALGVHYTTNSPKSPGGTP